MNIFVIGVAIVGLLSIVVLHKLALGNKTSSINSPQSSKILANYADEIAPHYAWYTEASLKRSLATGRVVLYFYAPWCSTCSVLDDELRKKSAKLPPDVTILKINYDSENEPARTQKKCSTTG